MKNNDRAIPAVARSIKLKHTEQFKTSAVARTVDGRKVRILDFDTNSAEAHIPEWAAHVRRHYCAEGDIDNLRRGTGKSRADFLRELVIPSAPNIIAAEFAEILVADYIQYRIGYDVPRIRYFFKSNRNVAVYGVDIVAFRKSRTNAAQDQLISCEVKAALVAANNDTLQNAINDAGGKDPLRLPETLNAFKHRFLKSGDAAGASQVERYQDKVGRPYEHITSAAAVHSEATWDRRIVSDARCSGFPDSRFELLLAIKGIDMMALAKKLYEAACA